MPVPKSPPPRAVAKVAVVADAPVKAGRSRGGRGRGGDASERTPKVSASAAEEVAASQTAGSSTVNDLFSFLTFVERHPAGTSVNANVDHYSSHGAYVRIGDIVGYVPLRLMAEPAPRSAREFMKVGESVTLIVESFVPTKRSVDLAVPGMGTAKQLGEAAPARVSKAAKPSKRAPKAAVPDEVVVVAATTAAGSPRTAPKKSSARSASKPVPTEAEQHTVVAVAKPMPDKAAAKKTAPAKTTPAKKAAPAKAKPVSAPATKAVATRAVATKAVTTNADTTRAAATKSVTTKATATKAATTKKRASADTPGTAVRRDRNQA